MINTYAMATNISTQKDGVNLLARQEKYDLSVCLCLSFSLSPFLYMSVSFCFCLPLSSRSLFRDAVVQPVPVTKDQSLSAPWLRVRGMFNKDRPENCWDWFPFTGGNSSQPEN